MSSKHGSATELPPGNQRGQIALTVLPVLTALTLLQLTQAIQVLSISWLEQLARIATRLMTYSVQHERRPHCLRYLHSLY